MTSQKLEEVKFESDRLWDYFQYHANQRIQTFKFFIVLCAAILSGSMSIFIKLLTDSSRDGLTEQTALTAFVVTTLGIILFIVSDASMA